MIDRIDVIFSEFLVKFFSLCKQYMHNMCSLS
jgi:hypothetical protein